MKALILHKEQLANSKD